MKEKQIVMLTGGGRSSVYMYNGLKDEFKIAAVIVEGKGSRKKFLQRRIKKLGLVKVVGQMLFQALIPRILEKTSQKRISEIKDAYRLDDAAIPAQTIQHVPSVNSTQCIDLIRSIRPDLIIVNGTKIISAKVLNSTDAIFINTHVGITPKYRGVHGGYWSVANADKENCGVTVHLVDSGIDTGGVLFQKVIPVENRDNFSTYTYLQIGEGISLMRKAIRGFVEGNLAPLELKSDESKLWYHPTLWYYLKKRILNGVK